MANETDPKAKGCAPARAGMPALLELGRAARARGDNEAALGHFLEAEAAAEANPWPRVERAATLRTLGRLAEAEEVYTAVLASHPANLQALLGLGHVALAGGRHEAALGCFAAAESAAGPSNPWPRLDRAMALRRLGRDAEAERLCAMVLEAHPGNVQALLGLGQIARARDDHAAALRFFRQAAEAAASTNPWPRLEEAATLRLMRLSGEAEAMYRAVLAAHPGNVQARMGLGFLARDRGERSAAADHFRQAAEAGQGSGAAWLELAADLRELGDFGESAAISRRLIAANPADLQAWLALGRTERAAGRREQALAAFGEARERHLANPYPLVEMAAELRALGRPAEAEGLLLQALRLDPANVQALEQLGDLARLARDHDSALARFTKAMEAKPSNVWPWLGIVRTLSDLCRRGEALGKLAEAEGHCGRSPDLEAARIDILRLSGAWPEALAAARKAVAEWPHHLGLWIHRFRMEKLLSGPEELAACLTAPPCEGLNAAVRLRHFRGLAAEEDWQLEPAVAQYEAALDLRPNDSWALSDLVRARILSLDVAGAASSLAQLVQLTSADATLRGRSARASQTHFGQILDEFTVDRDALSSLEAIRGMPPEDCLEPLCHIVRRQPDYTPAAMMLMIALRQAGRLALPPCRDRSRAPRIPQRIIQYWDTPELPPELEALAGTWRDAHPFHRFTRFDDRSAQDYLREACAPATLEAYRRAREPAQKADIFRLACLFGEGGWYIDLDDRCLAPLETVAPDRASLVLYQEDYGTVGNNVIGAVPHHPVIGLALQQAVEAVNRGDSDILWFSTGPGLLTRALAQTLAGSQMSLASWLRSISVLSRREMHRAVAMHCQVSYKNTQRHWSHTAFAGAVGTAPAAPRAGLRFAA